MTYKTHRKEIQTFHYKLRRKHGNALHCTDKDCEGTSKKFDWALKQGREYSDNPEDYLWLCKSCHRRYDLTPEKRQMAIDNLWWKKTKVCPGDLFRNGHKNELRYGKAK